MARFEVVQGDLTRQPDVDAIVNAANDRLLPGGGVCGAIHRAAGPTLAAECAAIGRCATGEAVATGAGDLPQRSVIHAVGPVWHGGDRGEPALLASAVTRSLEEADRVGARSVALPAISCGIYGYPLDLAAATIVGAARERLDRGDLDVELVRVVLFDRSAREAFAAAAG